MKTFLLKTVSVALTVTLFNFALADSNIDQGSLKKSFRRLSLREDIREAKDELTALSKSQSKILVKMGVFEDVKDNSLSVRFYELDQSAIVFSGLAIETVGIITAARIIDRILLKGKLPFLTTPIHLGWGVNIGLVGSNAYLGDRQTFSHNGFIYDYYLAEKENIVKKLQSMSPEAAIRWYELETIKLEDLNRDIENAVSHIEDLEIELDAIDSND